MERTKVTVVKWVVSKTSRADQLRMSDTQENSRLQHYRDDQTSGRSDPSLSNDRSNGQTSIFQKLQESNSLLDICCVLLLWTLLAFTPYLYRMWQSLLLLWTFSAFSPFQDDDSFLRRSVPSICSDRSNGKVIDFRQLKECPVLNICSLLLLWTLLTYTPYLYQIWQSLVLLLLLLVVLHPAQDLSVEEILNPKNIQRLNKVRAQLLLLLIWTFLVFSSHQFLSDDDQPSGRIIHSKKSGKRNSILNICCVLLLWTLLAFSPYLNICCLLLLWTYLAFSPD